MMGLDYGLAKRQWATTSSTSSSDLSSISGVYDADSPTLPHLYFHYYFVRRGTGNRPLDQPSGEKARLVAACGSRSC